MCPTVCATASCEYSCLVSVVAVGCGLNYNVCGLLLHTTERYYNTSTKPLVKQVSSSHMRPIRGVASEIVPVCCVSTDSRWRRRSAHRQGGCGWNLVIRVAFSLSRSSGDSMNVGSWGRRLVRGRPCCNNAPQKVRDSVRGIEHRGGSAPGGIRSCGLHRRWTAMAMACCGGKRLHFGGHIQRRQ